MTTEDLTGVGLCVYYSPMTNADRIRALMGKLYSCSPREKDPTLSKLLKALDDPRWYVAGWNVRPGCPHLKARLR